MCLNRRPKDEELRRLAAKRQPGLERPQRPLQAIPRLRDSPGQPKGIGQTLQDPDRQVLAARKTVRWEPELAEKQGATLFHHLLAALRAFIKRRVNDHEMPGAAQAAEHFAEGAMIVLRIMKGGIEDGQIELAPLKRQPVHFGLESDKRFLQVG